MNTAQYTVTSWVLALYVASVIAFSFSSEDVYLSNLIGLSLVLIFVLESMVKRLYFFQFFTWAHFLFFWFLLLCAGSLMFAPEGYLRVRTLALLFILSIVISNVVGRVGLRPVIWGVLIGLWYAIFAGLAQSQPMSSTRVASTLGNANTYALALVIGTLFCLYNLLVPQVKRFKSIYVAFNLACIPIFGHQIIFLTGSRKGIFVFVIIIVGTYIFFSERLSGFSKQISRVGGLVLIVGLIFAIQFSPFYKRVETVLHYSSGTYVSEGSINARAALLQEAFELWTYKPLLGWGADQFRAVSSFGRYSHNNYSEILVNHGLVGFVIFYAIYLLTIVKGIGLFKNSQDYSKNLGFWIILTSISFLIMGMASVSYYSKIHWVIFSSIFGLIAAKKMSHKIVQ